MRNDIPPHNYYVCSNESIQLCKNCKYAKKRWWLDWECECPRYADVDVVTGEVLNPLCDAVRAAQRYLNTCFGFSPID